MLTQCRSFTHCVRLTSLGHEALGFAETLLSASLPSLMALIPGGDNAATIADGDVVLIRNLGRVASNSRETPPFG